MRLSGVGQVPEMRNETLRELRIGAHMQNAGA